MQKPTSHKCHNKIPKYVKTIHTNVLWMMNYFHSLLCRCWLSCLRSALTYTVCIKYVFRVYVCVYNISWNNIPASHRTFPSTQLFLTWAAMHVGATMCDHSIYGYIKFAYAQTTAFTQPFHIYCVKQLTI